MRPSILASNRPVSHALNRDALREPGKSGGIYVAMHAHPVATLQGIRRQFKISRQAAIVGQQQQAFAVQVQPAYADHARKFSGKWAKTVGRLFSSRAVVTRPAGL